MKSPKPATLRTLVLATCCVLLADATRAQDAALIEAAKKEGQLVFREANHVPTHPNVKSKLPDLKPGGFRKLVISPEMSEQNLPTWTQIYKELFL